MTNEEKQDIASECRRLIAESSKEGAGYRTVAKGKVAEIALAALTAQPVKQPQTNDTHGFPEPAHILNSRWIEAIRAAGYEVQE